MRAFKMKERRLIGTTCNIILFILLFRAIGCAPKPSVSFCAKWEENLTEMEKNKSSILEWENLGTNNQEHGYLVPQGRTFGMIVTNTKLPLGEINIKALHYRSDGTSEPAEIIPFSISNTDPRADLRALHIKHLVGESEAEIEREKMREKMNRDEIPHGLLWETLSLKYVQKGKYYIFLEKDGKEIVGGDLVIK